MSQHATHTHFAWVPVRGRPLQGREKKRKEEQRKRTRGLRMQTHPKWAYLCTSVLGGGGGYGFPSPHPGAPNHESQLICTTEPKSQDFDSNRCAKRFNRNSECDLNQSEAFSRAQRVRCTEAFKPLVICNWRFESQIVIAPNRAMQSPNSCRSERSMLKTTCCPK